MDISTIVMISCVLTGVTMTVMAIVVAFVLRFGSQGVMMLFNRLTGNFKQDEAPESAYEAQAEASRPGVSSSDALRRRAREVDFPAAPVAAPLAAPQTAPAQFTAQATAFQPPAQPTLRARDTLQYSGSAPAPTFGAQAAQPTSASLSPSRPFQGGAMPARPAQAGFSPQAGFPQQNNFGQPSPQTGFPQQNNFGQPSPQAGFPQQNNFGQPSSQAGFPQQNNFGQPSPQTGFPQQNNFGQPSPQAGFPQQNNFGQPSPQPGFPQQNNFGQPSPQAGFPQRGTLPPPPPTGFAGSTPQQGGLGDYRPGLRNRPGTSDANDGSLRAAHRDSRRSDEQEIYDDEEGGFLSNLPL